MIILSWNYRGLGNLRTIHDLRRMVKEKNPNLVFVMETKLQKNKMEGIRMKLGFDNMFVVDCVGKSRGLALFWGEEIRVEIQNFSHRHINAIIRSHPHSLDWKFTGFYGHPEVAKCHVAWELMKYLAKLQPFPWMCVGDFNEVMTMLKKSGGNLRQ
jgi:exonuclease III